MMHPAMAETLVRLERDQRRRDASRSYQVRDRNTTRRSWRTAGRLARPAWYRRGRRRVTLEIG